MTLLQVGIVSRTFYYTPLWAAVENGAFAREGLDVQISVIGHGDQAALLREGCCDVTIAPPDGILQDVDRGGSTVILAGNSDRLSHCLIVQPEINSFADLRGKRVGVLSRTEGSFFHFELLARELGFAFPDEFVVVETGGAPLRHGLLVAREIDAGLQSFPWVNAAEACGLRNLLDISDYVPVWQFNTVNSNAPWCFSHAREVQTFLAALGEATEWFYTHKQEAARIAAARMELPLELALSAWDYFAATNCLTRNMGLNNEGLATVHAALQRAGLISPGPFELTRYSPPGACPR